MHLRSSSAKTTVDDRSHFLISLIYVDFFNHFRKVSVPDHIKRFTTLTPSKARSYSEIMQSHWSVESAIGLNCEQIIIAINILSIRNSIVQLVSLNVQHTAPTLTINGCWKGKVHGLFLTRLTFAYSLLYCCSSISLFPLIFVKYGWSENLLLLDMLVKKQGHF